MYEAVDGIQVGKRLNALRLERGLTETALAKEIGTSQSAVTMYESGRRIPRDDIKIRIAVFFGTSVESIFFAKKSHEV